jgi:4-hydroxythreonine-4-phosphate dehydrogenase
MQSPLALTMGEPAGIGPELALKAWLQRGEAGLPPFLLYADIEHITHTARQLHLDVPVQAATPQSAAHVFSTALPVFELDTKVQITTDVSANACAVTEAIDTTVDHVMSGKARAVVTNPIAKAPLMQRGFAFPGHTDYLGELARQRGHDAFPVMMLWCEELAVVPVTVHVPLAQVPALLTAELIVATGKIVADSLKKWFAIASPRIAVTGLNPHAGENGLLGTEEDAIIVPAIAQLRAQGIDARGPYPADTLFHQAARSGYDAVLAMYHDQGLIPIKTLAFERGVNITLGLPFVRTSPDHGTAFDIAGKGIANPASLIAALKLADRLTCETQTQ